MGSIWVIIGFVLYYLVKGIIWVIIDVHYFKTEYDNVLQPVANIIIWPLFSTKRTITQINSLLQSWKYGKSKD
jgi:hypothetical protein